MTQRKQPEYVIRKGKLIPVHYWTQAEDDYVRREYEHDRNSVKRIADYIGVTAGAVRAKAKILGISKRCYFYTDEELDYIRENYNRLTTETIARHLGRGSSCIRQMAYNMRIQKRDRDGWFTKQEVARILGADVAWVSRRMNGGYKLEMREFDSEKIPGSGGYSPWFITEKALRDFIRTYTNELIGRKVDIVMIVDILAGIMPVRRIKA